MAKYINADDLIKELKKYMAQIENSKNFVYTRRAIENMQMQVDRLPAADVVEVVRCKDCEFYDDVTIKGKPTGYGYLCNDNRDVLIAKYFELLKQGTNIETSYEEMQVIGNILFRMWQMGWLDRLEKEDVIRCKDCKYYKYDKYYQTYCCCRKPKKFIDDYDKRKLDDYCSKAKRRESK